MRFIDSLSRGARISLVLGIIVFINIIVSFVHLNIDLTEDNRFRLTEPTKHLIRSVPDNIYIRVLLDGEFPAGFKRLKQATKDLLDQMRSYNGYIEYSFENPNEGTAHDINKRREEYSKDGMLPTNLMVRTGTENKEQLIYPYAILMSGSDKMIVNLLENASGADQETNLGNSINLLEYKMANGLQRLLSNNKKNILFVTGHGELESEQTRSIESSLRYFYNFGRVNLDSVPLLKKEVDALIIAKPRLPFSEQNKFTLDQYIMRGGKVLWLVDGMAMSLDSMSIRTEYVPEPLDVGLSDLLYKYGLRIQSDFVLDLECSRIPQVIGKQGDRPQIELFPWYYHPLVAARSNHPISRNLDYINFEFVSSIDTIKTKLTQTKTALLYSSQYSRIQLYPNKVGFDILRYKPDPDKFNKPNIPISYLVEGGFSSAFENRMEESMLQGLRSIGQDFVSSVSNNKMILVSDGEIIKNLYDKENGKFAQLGYNKFEKTTFNGNRDFLSNALEYLTNDQNILSARSKEFKIRLLDKVKVAKERSFWQFLNIGLPLLGLVLFGIFNTWYRKKKYTGFVSGT